MVAVCDLLLVLSDVYATGDGRGDRRAGSHARGLQHAALLLALKWLAQVWKFAKAPTNNTQALQRERDTKTKLSRLYKFIGACGMILFICFVLFLYEGLLLTKTPNQPNAPETDLNSYSFGYFFFMHLFFEGMFTWCALLACASVS